MKTLTAPSSGSDLINDSNTAMDVPGTVFKVHSCGVAEAELEGLAKVGDCVPRIGPTTTDLLDDWEATRGLWMICLIATAVIAPILLAPTR